MKSSFPTNSTLYMQYTKCSIIFTSSIAYCNRIPNVITKMFSMNTQHVRIIEFINFKSISITRLPNR